MRTGNDLEQVSVVLSSRFFVKSFFTKLCVLSCSQFSVLLRKVFRGMYVLSCSRFSVFCEKFFVKSVFSVVLSSQFFCEKFFVWCMFSVVLSSQFSVPSIFLRSGPSGLGTKKIRFILKNTFYKKTIKEKGPESRGFRGGKINNDWRKRFRVPRVPRL